MQCLSLIHIFAPLCETSLTFDKMIGLAQIALTGFDIERLSIPSDVEGYASDYCEGGGWMLSLIHICFAAAMHSSSVASSLP